MANKMDFAQIVRALGLSVDSEEVAELLAEFELSEDSYRSGLYPEAVYFESPARGLALLSEHGIVDSIFFYSDGRDGFSQFEGTLSHGLTMASTKEEIRTALGTPSTSSSAVSLSKSLSHDGWDRFDLPTHTLHFSYGASDQIVLATISRR